MQLQQDEPASRMGYSVAEAADKLGLAPSGIWKWIALGKIHSVKIGNRRDHQRPGASAPADRGHSINWPPPAREAASRSI